MDSTLTQNTQINTAADQKNLLQQENAPKQTTKTAQRQLEEHDKELRASTWPPNSPDLDTVEHLRYGTSPMDGGPTQQTTELKGSATRALVPDTTGLCQTA